MLERVHKTFTRSEKRHAQAKHEQFKRNQPRMFQEQRNRFIQAIVGCKDVKLPIGKVIILR